MSQTVLVQLDAVFLSCTFVLNLLNSLSDDLIYLILTEMIVNLIFAIIKQPH